MSSIDVEVSKTIVLRLSEKKARWLRDYMQNSLTAETVIDSQNRKFFFDSIKRVLE